MAYLSDHTKCYSDNILLRCEDAVSLTTVNVQSGVLLTEARRELRFAAQQPRIK